MPDANLLTVGRPRAQAIAGSTSAFLLGVNNNAIIHCEGDNTLAVIVRLVVGTPVAGNLAVAVFPYLDIAANLPCKVALVPLQSNGPAVSGPDNWYYACFDITGFDAVQIQVSNSNTNAGTYDANWRLA